MIIKLTMDTSEVDDLFIEVDSKAYPNKRIYEPILENFCHYLIHGNATRFWMNQHIRKIYDISNEFSFFTSIYTAETDDKLYENTGNEVVLEENRTDEKEIISGLLIVTTALIIIIVCKVKK